MRTTLRQLVTAAGACLGLAFTALADDQPNLRFTEENLDFGCVGVDFKIFHTYKMVNHGKETIHIDTVTPHCDCTEVRFTDSTVKPGDTTSFLMVFNTADFYGPVEKDVRVHSSDRKSPKAYTYYRANIGQWLYSVQPKPVSIFFLPTNKGAKKGTLINHALDEISVIDIFHHSDIFEVKLLTDEASKGESIQYEVVAQPDLSPGTHLSNFTMTIDLHQDLDPLKITIPVKIVRY